MCLQHQSNICPKRKNNDTSRSINGTQQQNQWSYEHNRYSSKNETIKIYRGSELVPFYNFQGNWPKIIITTTKHLNQERPPQTHDWIQIFMLDHDKDTLLLSSRTQKEKWTTCQITGVIDRKRNQYQITLSKNDTPRVLRTTLEKYTACEFEPHFQSKGAFKARLNRSYNSDHDHNTRYGLTRPGVSAFVPSDISPTNARELSHSKRIRPMERPKGAIVTADRLQEIINIKERPGNSNAPLSNKHTEELKILRNKLIDLYKTEHLEALTKTEKQLQEYHKNIVTKFRTRLIDLEKQKHHSETKNVDNIEEINTLTLSQFWASHHQ